MSDRVAIYPGSFDPPTNGHIDIVERSSRLFDRVVVGVGRNLAKKTVFTADERIELMRDACARFGNVEVRAFDGLQVEFARACGASFVVRGIRALSDFEFEFEMANMNRSLAAEIEMVYLMTAPEFLFYALAHERVYGERPTQTVLHFLESGERGTVTPTEDSIGAVRGLVSGTASRIRAREFAPNPKGLRTCQQCPYHQICPSSLTARAASATVVPAS